MGADHGFSRIPVGCSGNTVDDGSETPRKQQAGSSCWGKHLHWRCFARNVGVAVLV